MLPLCYLFFQTADIFMSNGTDDVYTLLYTNVASIVKISQRNSPFN